MSEEMAKNTETTPTAEEKTFTQAEVNSMIEERIARERKGIPSDIDLKAYREWKKNSQTEAERFAEQQKLLTETQSELAFLKNESKVRSAEVNPEFADIITEKIMKMGGDFDTALKEYKKNNPHFFGGTVFRKTATSPTLSGGGNIPKSDSELINSGIRKLFNGG